MNYDFFFLNWFLEYVLNFSNKLLELKIFEKTDFKTSFNKLTYDEKTLKSFKSMILNPIYMT